MTTCNAPITATPTDGEAFHTGRKLHRVECATHGLIHPGTTGPDHWSDVHRRTGEVWPVDRPAPTPAVTPGLDLDAMERAERAMTAGPWSMRRESHFVQIRAADLEELATTEQARGVDVANAAGIVALRNSAPALIAEVRALRARLAEAKRLGLEFVALHREAGNCDGWGPFPEMRSKRMAAIAAALEAL